MSKIGFAGLKTDGKSRSPRHQEEFVLVFLAILATLARYFFSTVTSDQAAALCAEVGRFIFPGLAAPQQISSFFGFAGRKIAKLSLIWAPIWL
jgi:hypothetical protein